MNINRHNYEEFFLLYVDNELSAADRRTVDVFVQENPDLKEELLLLQQTIIDSGTIVFENKNALLKEEIALLQEKLLLFGDNELTAAASREIEALIATDATTAAEWNILQQTKLQPDQLVVFADKQSLYRTEGGRVVGIKWWRIAAAAVLLGFGIWGGVSVYKNNFSTTTGASTAKTNTGKPKENNTLAPANTVNSDLPVNKNVTDETTTASTPKVDVVKQPVEKINQPVEKQSTADQNNKHQQENITVVQLANKKPTNNLPKSYLENINNTARNETNTNSVLPKNDAVNNNSGNNNLLVQTNPKEKINNPVITDVNINGTDPKNIAAIPAVNKTTAESNDRFLNTDEERTQKSKVGGFLRKVKRLIERNTGIKTGNEVKVAGFEIAIK